MGVATTRHVRLSSQERRKALLSTAEAPRSFYDLRRMVFAAFAAPTV